MLDSIYNLMDTILPFQWLSYDFMKNALLAVLIVTPLFGLLSTMVVNNKMSFFADSLGHGAFTGIALGILFWWLKSNVGCNTIFNLLCHSNYCN